MSLSRDLSVLFFPLLVNLTHTLGLIYTLLGLLADTLNDILSLLLFSLSALHFLTSLHLEHIVLLVLVLFPSRLQLLLSFDSLLIQVHLECMLELALLGCLISSLLLLNFVLVAQYGAPLIEHFLLLLDR